MATKVSYCIATKEDGIEYVLHSNNQLYWNWWYDGKRVYPLQYKKKGNAERRLKKVQSRYVSYKLYIREIGSREFMKQID